MNMKSCKATLHCPKSKPWPTTQEWERTRVDYTIECSSRLRAPCKSTNWDQQLPTTKNIGSSNHPSPSPRQLKPPPPITSFSFLVRQSMLSKYNSGSKLLDGQGTLASNSSHGRFWSCEHTPSGQKGLARTFGGDFWHVRASLGSSTLYWVSWSSARKVGVIVL